MRRSDRRAQGPGIRNYWTALNRALFLRSWVSLDIALGHHYVQTSACAHPPCSRRDWTREIGSPSGSRFRQSSRDQEPILGTGDVPARVALVPPLLLGLEV